MGGRNLEVALAAVEALAGLQDTVLVAFATDGEDGPTDAAGAVVTGETFSRGISKGLIPASYLEDNDSYTYFDAVGGLIKTGSTGTNVNDLFLLFKF
jgi:hydroxypyruvate reductase